MAVVVLEERVAENSAADKDFGLMDFWRYCFTPFQPSSYSGRLHRHRRSHVHLWSPTWGC